MPQILEPFVLPSLGLPILDVRSPGEYAAGHVPGASSLPLFSDTERAAVGICYAREGNQAAVRLGLEYAGPKLGGLVDQARTILAGRALAHGERPTHAMAGGSELVVHCWRGGMRSASVAWLLETAGLRVAVLAGGYRGWRRYAHTVFAGSRPLLVVGGMTGSGKTAVLRALARRGEAVLDLESLAKHRGSAFGDLLQPPQPSQEQFENDVAAVLMGSEGPIWVEDESFNLGQIRLPPALVHRIGTSPIWIIEADREKRVGRLVAEYAAAPPAELAAAIGRIRKRLGAERHAAALAALERGDMAEVARLCLHYYDKAYRQGLESRFGPRLEPVPPVAMAAWDEVNPFQGAPV
jgi:tRNA 2-selenouridine synthase